jgi:hypothetical protein
MENKLFKHLRRFDKAKIQEVFVRYKRRFEFDSFLLSIAQPFRPFDPLVSSSADGLVTFEAQK